jgi:hypothetical protein
MAYIVIDGETRPNQGAAGWRAPVRQGTAFTMLRKPYPRAPNNMMELRPVKELVIPSTVFVAWLDTFVDRLKSATSCWRSVEFGALLIGQLFKDIPFGNELLVLADSRDLRNARKMKQWELSNTDHL